MERVDTNTEIAAMEEQKRIEKACHKMMYPVKIINVS
jgi:hypothetical protein